MGFGANVENEKFDENQILHKAVQHDLVKYGLIPELIGRIPVITVLDNLDKDALVRIMVEPKTPSSSNIQSFLSLTVLSLNSKRSTGSCCGYNLAT